MLRSMYAGVSGMKGFQTKLDVIGNNISNVNTVGYKKSTVNFQDLLSQNLSDSGVNPMQVGLGANVSAVNVNHNPGSLMTTGVQTDLAIMGDGFFVVQKPAANPGEAPKEFLTRAGNFNVDAEGDLVTSQGYSVLDANGAAIQIDPNNYLSFSIDRKGVITGKTVAGDIEEIASLGLAFPANPGGLKKVGGSMYEMTESAQPGGQLNIVAASQGGAEIASGALEMSNVDLTEEFTEMIVAQRGFQANSRIITTSDEILQEVVNLKR